MNVGNVDWYFTVLASARNESESFQAWLLTAEGARRLRALGIRDAEKAWKEGEKKRK